jgi:Protein of unknown function (DUF1569)
MATLFNNNEYQNLLQRIEQITPQTQNKWGKMDAAQMLKHLNLGVGGSVNDLKLEDESNILTRSVVKWVVMYVINSFPKSSKTGKSLVVKDTQDFEQEKRTLLMALEKMQAKGENGVFNAHPLFGKLTGKEWGVLGYKHLNHHLKQFGV